jgi:hypothetical protein
LLLFFVGLDLKRASIFAVQLVAEQK